MLLSSRTYAFLHTCCTDALVSFFYGVRRGVAETCSVCGIQDSKAQVTALQLIIGTLQRTRVFGVENRDTLTHKATGVRQ